jgi:hypothetical protein
VPLKKPEVCRVKPGGRLFAEKTNGGEPSDAAKVTGGYALPCVPAGNTDEVVICGTPIVYALEPLGGAPVVATSVTLAVNEKVPGEVGVPLMSPELDPRVSPGGRLPAEMVHEGVPPGGV